MAEAADSERVAGGPFTGGGSGTIVIIGAPGSGKSTVGSLVARRLGLDFVDVDEVIEQRAGKRIGDIFLDEGEAYFRRLERD
ncbi:MAG: hypothetical protein M0Z51_11570, partial [Propionibacterium sp.]|nr:hypothetical protein [Propionibacterium sp.]